MAGLGLSEKDKRSLLRYKREQAAGTAIADESGPTPESYKVKEAKNAEMASKLGSQIGDFMSINPNQGADSFKTQEIDVGSSDADSVMEARRKALAKLAGY